MTKSNLFDNSDSARISVSQPLHVERGSIDFKSLEVVDRQTGELGLVTQNIALQTGKRSFVTEAIYRRALLDGKAEVNLFGRARLGRSEEDLQDPSLTLGTSLRIAFSNIWNVLHTGPPDLGRT
ncbi:MAG: hypothetical protein U5J78_00640 [Parasphingorhabdus sp.]|nr:hypothetical protein [Parasphingorhabdus sp.]